MALHGLHSEKLKMGKDVRGIERGKCACGECGDFMRSDGATCGYCGCLPTRHCKKDARYSSPKTLRIWNMTLIQMEIPRHRA